MKKTLLWACAVIIVLGAALTVYAAPAPETDVTDVTDYEYVTGDGDESLDPRDFFEVNELGLTYGYAIYDDVRPDLAAAIGTGGVHGYVYMEELLSVGAKRFPEDIVTYIPSSIPLYASDGVTVIGEFPIGARTDDVPAFNVTIEPQELLKSDTGIFLETGETVRIYGTCTPIYFDLVFGLVTPDGRFYGASATDGMFDKTIRVPDSGSYFLGFRNNSNSIIRASGYVSYHIY